MAVTVRVWGGEVGIGVELPTSSLGAGRRASDPGKNAGLDAGLPKRVATVSKALTVATRSHHDPDKFMERQKVNDENGRNPARDQKANPLNANELAFHEEAGKRREDEQKSGAPKNEGMSTDVVENK